MRKNKNEITIEGYVYQHDLTVKTVKNETSPNYGREFIAGTLEVAVDEDALNVIPVHFTYITETTSSGNKNVTYATLKSLIDSPEKTWLNSGKEGALKVSIRNSALALNDFYNRDGQLVSQKRPEGGFVTIVNQFTKDRNKFKVDMIINKVVHIEADVEKHIDEDYIKICGAVFNFRGGLLPVEFSVRKPQGIAYFEDLGISPSNIVYATIWGVINCQTIKIPTVTENAFGEPEVTISETKSKEWLVTGVNPTHFEFGDESVMTADELQKAIQDREIYLAGVKKRNDDYQASKQNKANPASMPVVEQDFKF